MCSVFDQTFFSLFSNLNFFGFLYFLTYQVNFHTFGIDFYQIWHVFLKPIKTGFEAIFHGFRTFFSLFRLDNIAFILTSVMLTLFKDTNVRKSTLDPERVTNDTMRDDMLRDLDMKSIQDNRS